MAINRTPLSSVPARALLDRATLTDLEAMRLLLRGQSVIDWHRLAFRDPKEVERFLRINEFDPESTDDLNRLEELRDEAVDYLQRTFSYRIPPEVSSGIPVQDLFLLASQRGRRQTYACVVLKVMHVIHHLAGRELIFKLPISDDQVFGLVEKKVLRTVEEIRGAGYPIVEFAWSRKERDSLITKLLAKKASIAANVYDKLRFRLITRSREDLAAVLIELTHRLVPFNYVIPGESVNNILDVRKIIEETPVLAPLGSELQPELDVEPERLPAAPVGNEFSGPAYRVINFVTDLPVRIDDYLDAHVDPAVRDELGSIIFVLTEFQVLDAETAGVNESGENSHAAYKERQATRVKSRLTGGSRALRERGDAGEDEETQPPTPRK
jgi:uncharacterized protein (TIGR04552 family)